MGEFKDIAFLLDCISDGVNPCTKEIFNRWELVQDPEFQKAYERLKKTYRIPKSDSEPSKSKISKSPKLSYPWNFLKKIMPDQERFPEDVEQRIETILHSPAFKNRTRNADMLRYYYNDGMTLEAIGNLYSVTRETVRLALLSAQKVFSWKRVASYLIGETDQVEFPDLPLPKAKPQIVLQKPIYHAEEIEQVEVPLPPPPEVKPKKALPKLAKVQKLAKPKKEEIPPDPIVLPTPLDQPFSITGFAVELSKSGIKPRLTRTELTAWLFKNRDITYIHDGESRKKVPTPTGEEHGLSEETGIGKHGREYRYIALGKSAQEYIISHLDEILSMREKSRE